MPAAPSAWQCSKNSYVSLGRHAVMYDVVAIPICVEGPAAETLGRMHLGSPSSSASGAAANSKKVRRVTKSSSVALRPRVRDTGVPAWTPLFRPPECVPSRIPLDCPPDPKRDVRKVACCCGLMTLLYVGYGPLAGLDAIEEVADVQIELLVR